MKLKVLSAYISVFALSLIGICILSATPRVIDEFYIENGYVYEIDEELRADNVQRFSEKTNEIYENFIKGKAENYYVSVIPDKGYFSENQSIVADAKEIAEIFSENVEDAQYIDIFEDLSLESYYKTDPHISQDKLLDVADTLNLAFGFEESDTQYEETVLEDFFGVYVRQSGLQLGSDDLIYLENEYTKSAVVENLEKPQFDKVYDVDEFYEGDGYNLFLSGATPITTINNESAKSDRELIVFRDSFGSALAPLLLENYSSVTLVDLRYFTSDLLVEYIDFTNKDVLVIYSSTILNSNIIFK